MNAQDSKKRLIWCAVPTNFAVPNPPPTVTPKRKVPLDRSKSALSTNIKKRKMSDQTSEVIIDQSGPSSTVPSTSPAKKAMKREKKKWQNKYYMSEGEAFQNTINEAGARKNNF